MEDSFLDSIRLLQILGNVFRLSNTLASFQGYINNILGKKLDIFINIYLDNIFIYNKNPGQLRVNTV